MLSCGDLRRRHSGAQQVIRRTVPATGCPGLDVDERADGEPGARVVGTHEGFADQEPVDSPAGHCLHIVPGHDAAFGDGQAVGADALVQVEGGLQGHLERVQVAVIDAHQWRSQGEGIVHFRAIVDLYQDIQADLMSDTFQLLQLVPGEAGGNQQDTVGANRPAFVHLIRRHHEVLADHRQAAGGPGGFQVVFVALEEVLVGKHRQAGGAAFLVTLGNAFRLKRIPQDAFAR